LLVDYLLPGKRLYLLATGTGLAPFLSIIRDPETYERFEKIVLMHCVREAAELAYHDYLIDDFPADEIFGEMARKKLIYHPRVTREPFRNRGRITDAITTGELHTSLGLPELNSEEDRVMLCGSPEMLAEMKTILKRGVASQRGTPLSPETM
jgi:ferredoxin--NADP+ reductase